MKRVLASPLSNLGALLAALLVLLGQLFGSPAGAPGDLVALGATNFDVLQAGDGSVTEPAFSFTSDTDTGVYRSGANTLDVAAGGTRALTVSSSAVTLQSGVTLSLQNDSIQAAEITNITRTVSLALRSWIECTTDAGADINFSSGADAFPDFINSATDGLGFYLAFDATGGSVDTAYACTNLLVPADYASGGAVVATITKGAETGANSEVLNCAGSINGAALGAGGTVTLTGTAAAKYSCTPTLTGLAAGNGLSVEIHITSGGTADDEVRIHGIAFEYTATQ